MVPAVLVAYAIGIVVAIHQLWIRWRLLFHLQERQTMTIQEELEQIGRISQNLITGAGMQFEIHQKLGQITSNLNAFLTQADALRQEIANLQNGLDVPQSVIDALAVLEAQAQGYQADIDSINNELTALSGIMPVTV